MKGGKKISTFHRSNPTKFLTNLQMSDSQRSVKAFAYLPDDKAVETALDVIEAQVEELIGARVDEENPLKVSQSRLVKPHQYIDL